jgi:uncharacterized membrane protein
MTEPPARATPEQARQQLQEATARTLGSQRDARLYAAFTVCAGLTLALFVILLYLVSVTAAVVSTAVALVPMAGFLMWIERTASTVPRRTRTLTQVGSMASIVVMLMVVTPVLNMRSLDGTTSWPMVLAGAVVVAAPNLLTAMLIERSTATR